MALYHPGAFAGSLHGSTKTTTFRRSKTGIVAYDRPDSHPTRGTTVKAGTLRTCAFYAAANLCSMLGVIPSSAYEGGKRSYGYNEFMGALASAVAKWMQDEKSPLFENYSKEAWDAYIQSQAKDAGSAYAHACDILGTLSTSFGFEWTKGTGKAIATMTGSKTAQSIAVNIFDGKSHKVDVTVVSLVDPSVIVRKSGVSDGLSTLTITTNAALKEVTNEKSVNFGKFPALAIVEVDGKPVNAASSTVYVLFPNA